MTLKSKVEEWKTLGASSKCGQMNWSRIKTWAAVSIVHSTIRDIKNEGLIRSFLGYSSWKHRVGATEKYKKWLKGTAFLTLKFLASSASKV